MIQQFFEWLQSIGFTGLFLTMFLEGSSLPFPGIVFVLSYGYVLSPGWIHTIFIAMGMSFFYTLASLIPYFIGKRVKGAFPKKMKKGLEKGISLFEKYGIWSIAFSRPFGIGNYISYVAGMSRVHILKYGILTFIGIYPWSYVMILVGDYFEGNYEKFQAFLHEYSEYGYGAIIAGFFIAIIVFYTVRKRKRTRVRMEEGGNGE